MHLLVKIIRSIYVAIYWALMCTIACVACLFNYRGKANLYYVSLFVRPLLKPIYGIDCYIDAEDKSRKLPKNAVYVSNHQNTMDIVLLAKAMQKDTVTVGKTQLAFIPFFGWMYWLTGNILLNKKVAVKAMKTIEFVVDKIKNHGYSVWLFPEGTRSYGRYDLAEFKPGAFLTAIEAGVPIVPIVVSDLNKFDMGNLDNGKVIIKYLKPINTKGLTRRQSKHLAAHLEKLFVREYHKLNDYLATNPEDVPLSDANNFVLQDNEDWEKNYPPIEFAEIKNALAELAEERAKHPGCGPEDFAKAEAKAKTEASTASKAQAESKDASKAESKAPASVATQTSSQAPKEASSQSSQPAKEEAKASPAESKAQEAATKVASLMQEEASKAQAKAEEAQASSADKTQVQAEAIKAEVKAQVAEEVASGETPETAGTETELEAKVGELANKASDLLTELAEKITNLELGLGEIDEVEDPLPEVSSKDADKENQQAQDKTANDKTAQDKATEDKANKSSADDSEAEDGELPLEAKESKSLLRDLVANLKDRIHNYESLFAKVKAEKEAKAKEAQAKEEVANEKEAKSSEASSVASTSEETCPLEATESKLKSAKELEAELKGSSRKLEAEYRKEARALKKELRALKAGYKARLRDLSGELTAERAELALRESEAESEVKKLNKKFSADFKALDAKASKLKAELSAQINKKTQEANSASQEEINSRVEELNQKLAQERAELEEKFDHEKSKIEAESKVAKTLYEDKELETRQLIKDLDDKFSASLAELTAKEKALAKDLSNCLDKLREDSETKLKNL